MIWRVFILLIVPVAAFAEPVPIRSGEHETFSRLVLSIGADTDWSIDESDGSVVLQLEGRSDGFDVSKIFDRIPRDRLNGAAQTAPNTLRLSLDCQCEVDAFEWQPGELVVDIADRSEVAAPLDAVSVPENTTVQSIFTMPANAPLQLPNMLVLPQSVQAAAPMGPLINQVSPTDDTISIAEIALAEGIARAASQGFLQPSMRPIPTMPLDGIAAEDVAIMTIPDPPVVVGRPGIGISTALDRDLALLGNTLGRTLDQHCVHEDMYRIDAWGDGRAFHTQAAALAEALAGEFGEEPREAQEDLARLYIHFGFGVEARAVLAADTTSSRSRLVLAELAGIVDDYAGDYPLTAAQTDCTTPAALWAFLINPTTQDEDERNYLIQQFYVLPTPLRDQVSPRLARRFVEVGNPEAALRLLRAAENSDADLSHDVQSARALVSEQFEDPQGARDILSIEAGDNARTTPQSLIRLIELDLEQGTIPAEGDMLLVAAMRHEHRGSPIEQNLEDAEALGRMAIGQFQLALDLVVGREDGRALTITDLIFAAMTDNASAVTFLEFAYGDIPIGVTSTTENAVAQRLILLGFPDRATLLLRGPAEREAAAERRYLRAEAAIDTQDFGAAIETLLGMTDERARSLRARAFEGLGEHRAALASLRPDQDASTSTLQFRAGAWERLTVQDDEVLSSFAQSVLQTPNVAAIETLADRRAVLAQSQESRRAVQDLLLRFDGTTPQE